MRKAIFWLHLFVGLVAGSVILTKEETALSPLPSETPRLHISEIEPFSYTQFTCIKYPG